MERTMVFIKPDSIQRGLAGEIISRFERKGLKIVGMKMLQLTNTEIDMHYAHLADKPFFQDVKSYMQSTPLIALCLEGLDCVETVRRLCGPTNARDAAAGTIRGDLGMSVQSNLLHASDSVETALREIEAFFAAGELFHYEKIDLSYLYGRNELNSEAVP